MGINSPHRRHLPRPNITRSHPADCLRTKGYVKQGAGSGGGDRQSPQIILLIAVILTIANLTTIVWYQPAVAQVSNVANTELIMLRNRVSRLENQINRANQFNRNQLNYPPSSPPPVTTETPPVVNGQPIGQSSPMYQRLATLVIELKEEVRALQQQVNQLQEQIK